MNATITSKQLWPCRVLHRASAPGESHASIVISTDRLDRMRDRIMQDGLSFADWVRGGAPVLWAHDSHQLPIGKARTVTREGRGHRMAFDFLQHDQARRVREAFDAGVLGASIGFIPELRTPNDYGGDDIHRASVIEVSLTAIPANPDCHKALTRLGLVRERNLDNVTPREVASVLGELAREHATAALGHRFGRREILPERRGADGRTHYLLEGEGGEVSRAEVHEVFIGIAAETAKQLVCRLTGRVD